LLRCFPGGTALSIWTLGVVLPSGVPLIDPDTSPGYPGDVRLSVASIEATGTVWMTTVCCGLEWLIWLLGCSRVSDQVSASSGAHHDVLLPSGGLHIGGSSAEYFHIPPSFTLIRGLVFSGERCRRIHPSIRPFNRSPGQYPCVRRTLLSVAELPATARSSFTLEDFPLYRFWQRHGPRSAQWPASWAPSSGFHRPARVGRIKISGFATCDVHPPCTPFC
jgi:hypothetical protein